jgi:hypothetical protein
MDPVPHEVIYAEMTAAFTTKCNRELSPDAKVGLRDFIELAVIRGNDKDPELYPLYRLYLRCRFETIAETLNRETGMVIWSEFHQVASDEVADLNNEKCKALIGKLGGGTGSPLGLDRKRRSETVAESGKKSALRDLALRICVDYTADQHKPPPGSTEG